MLLFHYNRGDKMNPIYVLADNELGYDILDAEQIDRLADLAVRLEPDKSEVVESAKYSSALDSYIRDNNIDDSEYFHVFNNPFGQIILDDVIKIKLMEKELSNNGTDDESLRLYKKLLEDYEKNIITSDYIQRRENKGKRV